MPLSIEQPQILGHSLAKALGFDVPLPSDWEEAIVHLTFPWKEMEFRVLKP